MKRSMFVAFFTISILSIFNQVFAFGCSFKGPPWDPCQFFESSDVPSSTSEAKRDMPKIMRSVDVMRQTKTLTIDKLSKLGFLGNPSEKETNGTALEFLMWVAGFQMPAQKRIASYTEQSFYNGTYGYAFKYFLVPFSYQNGWLKCQGLKYTPSPEQIQEARSVLNSFNTVINSLLKPYIPHSVKDRTAQQTIKVQMAFNDKAIEILKAFHYDSLMEYARSQFQLYVAKQNSYVTRSRAYLNSGCLRDVIGKTSIHSQL